MFRLDDTLFDEIEQRAEVSSRRRMHYDLRTSAVEENWMDQSQRILNVLMKDTVVPIHRHTETNESVIILRGSGYEVVYEDVDGTPVEKERFLMRAGSDCAGVVVGRGEWHTFIPLEDGTTIFEAKDRPYDPVATEELFEEYISAQAISR